MNTPKPMLASMYIPQAAAFPVDVQPKLDGLRCLVGADDLVLHSRGGKTSRAPMRRQRRTWLPPASLGMANTMQPRWRTRVRRTTTSEPAQIESDG